MISFRYHLVSIAAVLIALAAGVALGAGPLQNTPAVTDDVNEPKVEISPALAGFEAAFAKANSGPLISRKLRGSTVVVMTTPSAREAEIKSITEYIESAGGQVSGQVTLTSKLLDPANRQFAEGVATQSAGAAAGTGEDYDKVGSALARAFVTEEPTGPDSVAQTVRSAFVEGGLIEYVTEPETTAELVLVVAGPTTSTSQGAGTVVASLVAPLDSAGAGVVVAGPASSATDDGIVATVRESSVAASVSTVDVTDLGSGRILTVLALGQERSGTSGAWGTSTSADGPLPR